MLKTKIDQQNTMEEWRILFFIGGAVYIMPAIFFIIFGSGNVQEWNEPANTRRRSNKSTKLDTF